uniref:V-type proton ATPase subunit a n=1 Tax=Megaselia scalaris TaxID=36166 RepID=T1GG72_MEGSC
MRLNMCTIPPTYLKVNKFTKAFQAIVDAYGVPNYKELNPAPYTIITFPFLFAVMFGDWGHGLIVFCLSLYLIFNEKNIAKADLNDIFKIMFDGRYIIMMLGAFSIYTGLIYNDIFSKDMKLMESSWRTDLYNITTIGSLREELALNPITDYVGTPYIFGFDPMIPLSGETSILIKNSIKMKMSIILGFFQMLMGIVLSAINAIYYKSYISLFLVFLPTMTFFCSLFGYLLSYMNISLLYNYSQLLSLIFKLVLPVNRKGSQKSQKF